MRPHSLSNSPGTPQGTVGAMSLAVTMPNAAPVAPIGDLGHGPEAALTLTQGEPKTINSFRHRHAQLFCSIAVAGVFYRNEDILPGISGCLQTATLDDPEPFLPGYRSRTAERMGWHEAICMSCLEV